MHQNYRDYIHGVARVEKQIRELQMGDHVTVSARYGEFAGDVEEVKAKEPGEGNYVVIVNAVAYNGDAMDADIHTVTIDYEGAFTSNYPYYAPYTVATAGQRSLQNIEEIQSEEPRGVEA